MALTRQKPDLSSVESDLKALATASKTLNNLTDQLTEQVAQIESVINTLNLGLRVSVTVHSYGSDDEPWLSSDLRLSYDKNDGKWGFEIEEFDVDQNADHYLNYKSWVFKDAPRALRLEVVHKIPELIKAMVKESETVAKQVTEKLEDAKAIASTLFKPALDGSMRK
jgi:hypothetical protein